MGTCWHTTLICGPDRPTVGATLRATVREAGATALRAGRIGGAGFDVLSVEPPHAGNPLLALRLPNFVLTPHIAWASAQAMQGLADQLIDNLESFVAGTPRNVVA